MAGYTRQATANIQTGKVIYAEDINAEYNALAAAFSGSTGHSHDGSTGNGPKINLDRSVEGILPLAMGGTGASNAAGARASLGANNASNLTTGTLPNARLSGDYSFGQLTLSGDLKLSGVVEGVSASLRPSPGGWAVRTESDSSNYILSVQSSSGAERFKVIHGAPLLQGDSAGWSVAGNFAAEIVTANSEVVTSGNVSSRRSSSDNVSLGGGPGRGTTFANRGGIWSTWYIDTNDVSGGYEWRSHVNGSSTSTIATLSTTGVLTTTRFNGLHSGNGSLLTNLNASNISSGTVDIARLPDLPASKVTSGTFAVDRIPNLPASILTSGTLPNERLNGSYSFGSLTLSGSLTVANNITAGGSLTASGSVTALGNEGVHYGDGTVITITPGSGNSTGRTIKLRPRGSGASIGEASIDSDGNLSVSGTISGNGSGLTNLNGSNISSGTLDIARLPDLPASKVTSGVFNVARIPDLDASKVTGGTFDPARIPNHSANLLTSGTVPSGRLNGSYSFGSLTLSGTLTVANTIASSPDSARNVSLGEQSARGMSFTNRANTWAAWYINTNDISSGFEWRVHEDGANFSTLASLSTTGILTASRFNGLHSGNGSLLTNLNGSNVSSGTVAAARIANLPASKITSGTLSNDRLSGDYSFDNLTLSGGLSTNAIRVGADSFHVISRNTTNSWLELEGGNGGSSSSRILLYGPDNSNGRGDLRHDDTVRLRWGNSTVEADNGAGGLLPVATVSQASTADVTIFPIGHLVFVRGGRSVRNSSDTVRLHTSNDNDYDIGGSGAALGGIWRHNGGAADNGTIIQRRA